MCAHIVWFFLQPRVLLHGAAHVVLVVKSLPVNETNKHTVNQLYSNTIFKNIKKKKCSSLGNHVSQRPKMKENNTWGVGEGYT